MKRVALALALAAPLTTLSRRPAVADPVPMARTALPAPGATGVPLNSRVIAHVTGREHAYLYRLHLRVAGGAEVPASVRYFSSSHGRGGALLTPDAPLAAGTTYEIVDDLDALNACDPTPPVDVCAPDPGGPYADAGPDLCAPAVDRLAVVSSFTTGDTLDTTPPEFNPGYSVVTDDVRCDTPECCWPYHARTWSVAWNEAHDDQPVLYEVTAGNSFPPIIDDVAALEVHGAFYCYKTSSFMGLDSDLVGLGPVQVRAVDLAGNATTADLIDVNVPACPPEDQPERDAGPGWVCDGGFHFDDGGVPPIPHHEGGDGGGCSVGGPHGGDGALAVVLIGFVLYVGASGWRDRRRR